MKHQKFSYTSYSPTHRAKTEGGTLLRIEGNYYVYRDRDGEATTIDITSRMIDDVKLDNVLIDRKAR